MNDQNRLVWLKGKLIRAKDATVSVFSPAFLYGVSVFDGIRYYKSENDNKLNGFRVRDHIRRLLNSAKLIRLEHSYSSEEIEIAIIETIQGNNFDSDLAVRPTIFLDGEGNWSSRNPCGLFIAPILRPRENVIQGLKCNVSSWERINDRSISPRIKAGANYINSRMAQLESSYNQFDTSILLNDRGKVAESTGSCIFMVRDGKLITPHITSSILESITRDTVITIAKDMLNIDVEEREIDRTELYLADELFLCGTALEIKSITSIDKMDLSDPNENSITSKIHKEFIDIVYSRSPDPYNWIEKI